MLLLDEPLSALDAIERVRLRGEIRALQQRLGVTTMMVTHDQEEALSMADRIVVMNAGRIEQVGTPREIYEAPATPFVADFVGKINVLPAVAEGGGQFRVGAVSLAVARPDIATGTAVKLYLRPGGDRAERDGAAVNGNRFGARIAKVEFLGAFCMVGLALDAPGAPALVANVPRHDVDAGNMAAGTGGHREPACRRAAHTWLAVAARLRMSTPAAGASRRRRRGASVRPRVHWQDRLAQALLLGCCAVLALFLLAPLATILVKSVQDKDGALRRPAAIPRVFRHAGAESSIWNTFWVAVVVTAITIPLAFAYAYALTRSCMRGKIIFRVIALTPILAPSLLAAISFIQWFGNQGALKWLLRGASIYGPLGIISPRSTRRFRTR